MRSYFPLTIDAKRHVLARFFNSSDKLSRPNPPKGLIIEPVNEWENKEKGIKQVPHSTIKLHIDKRKRSPGTRYHAVILRKVKTPDDNSFDSSPNSSKENIPLPSNLNKKPLKVITQSNVHLKCNRAPFTTCNSLGDPSLTLNNENNRQGVALKDTNLNIKMDFSLDRPLKDIGTPAAPYPVSFPVPIYYGGYFPQPYFLHQTPINHQGASSPPSSKSQHLSFETAKPISISKPTIEYEVRNECIVNKEKLVKHSKETFNKSMESAVKSPVLLTFDMTRNQSLADLFKAQRKRLADKIGQRKISRKYEVKSRSKEEILAQRKEMMKPKKHAPTAIIKIEKEPRARRKPSPELLARLAAGIRSKISKEEMYKLTSKNYELLPEIKLKREIERKKEELRKRVIRAQELKKVLFIHSPHRRE